MDSNTTKPKNGLLKKSRLFCDDRQPRIFLSVNTLPISIKVAVLGSILLVSGCSQQSEYEPSSSEESVADYATEDTAAAGAEAKPLAIADVSSDPKSQSSKLSVENLSGDSQQTLGSQATDIQIAGKELLITARADFKVEDVVKSTSAIESLTRQQGGYVALSKTTNVESASRTFTKGDQNITLTTYYRQANMTVRIPRAKVSEFLKKLQQQVAFLNEQEFTAQDVTLDIYREQLASKLNSEMVAELSQERLNSKNAKDQNSNVESIMATYAARQQQEYAKLEQMNIEDKVKYSTIDLKFTQPDSSYKETTQNLDLIIDAERPSFGVQVGEAFKEGWETLRTVAITLIQLWWLIIVGGVFYLIYRAIKAAYRLLFSNKHYRKPLKPKRSIQKETDDNIDDSHF